MNLRHHEIDDEKMRNRIGTRYSLLYVEIHQLAVGIKTDSFVFTLQNNTNQLRYDLTHSQTPSKCGKENDNALHKEKRPKERTMTMMRGAVLFFILLVEFLHTTESFQATHPRGRLDGSSSGSTTTRRATWTDLLSTTTRTATTPATATTTAESARTAAKQRLLEALLLVPPSSAATSQTAEQYATIFIDRLTKQPLIMEVVAEQPKRRSTTSTSTSRSFLLTGDRLGPATSRRPAAPRKLLLRSDDNTYIGYSNSYLDLLEPSKEQANDEKKKSDGDDDDTSSAAIFLAETSRRVTRAVTPWLPPPLRSVFSTTLDADYLPMRDLFTNPAVSFAYERGWRQGFAQAGFPGPDRETELANDYFAPVVVASSSSSSSVLVDMSCATGLFTRRFADSKRYGRVLGCDYSPSMLDEAVRRRPPSPGRLDWIRLDVAQMPFTDASVDVLHAGAAMHCWPELPKAAREIYRVLKPGGRYFATTFLSQYFANLQRMGGGLEMDGSTSSSSEPSRSAFQYFQSVDVLRKLIVDEGGFESEKVQIEVLGAACVVIRCEK
jgi:SAM-dependent methyltransferase